MSSIAQNPNTANVRPRLTFGDIDPERRTMPLVSLAETARDLSAAVSVIESLIEHCAIHHVGGSAVVRGEQFLMGRTARQVAFYGAEDGDL